MDIAKKIKNTEEHEFSEGFLHDLSYLLDCCKRDDTDSITLNFNINGNILSADIVFSAKYQTKDNEDYEK